MNSKQKRLIYIISGTVGALLVTAIILVLVAGSGARYKKYYQAAKTALLNSDYETALVQGGKALEQKDTEEAYLLVADSYCALGNTAQAIRVLRLGKEEIGGTRISETLARLEAQTPGTEPVEVTDGTKVNVAGSAVEPNAKTLILSQQRLTAADLKAVSSLTALESLSISNCGLKDLAFLSGLTHLTSLQLAGNNITDLSPLAGLSALKTLYLDGNPVDDFAPLYTLCNLHTLSMKGISVTDTQLEDLRAALKDCSIFADAPTEEVVELTLGGRKFKTDVTELNLGGLGIEDVSVLRECTHLKKLDLRDNRITDISPLLDLQELEWLCLWNNQVSDINPLMTLTGLSYLDIDGNKVDDLSVLRSLTNLEELWLNNNQLGSIDPLKSLSKLQRLGLENTGIQDEQLRGLTGLTQLKELNIKGNDKLTAEILDVLGEALTECSISHDELLYSVEYGGRTYLSDAVEIDAPSAAVSDLHGLEKFSKLRVLKLYANQITDLSPLKELNSLEELWLYGNGIADLSPLGKLTNLQYLDLQSNKVSDLSPLSGCIHLRSLLLNGNRVSDLLPLSACTEMTVLDLDNNDISDISALAPLTSLSTLHLENNRITDLSALYSLVNLETLYLSGNDLNADDIRALQTMLPRCFIVHDVEMGEETDEVLPEEE